MDIEKSYNRLSSYFDLWVRLIEIKTRVMEVQDSKLKDLKILIISPPTDTGIRILSKTNLQGESYLLCFSSTLEEIAKKYLANHNVLNVKTRKEHFFRIPFDDVYFDVIFANCFFDFCQEHNFDKIIGEIIRVLKNKGELFSVYMDYPSNITSKVWSLIFNNFALLSQDCHPVDIKPSLARQNFSLKKDLSMRRFGFPFKYIQAKK